MARYTPRTLLVLEDLYGTRYVDSLLDEGAKWDTVKRTAGDAMRRAAPALATGALALGLGAGAAELSGRHAAGRQADRIVRHSQMMARSAHRNSPTNPNVKAAQARNAKEAAAQKALVAKQRAARGGRDPKAAMVIKRPFPPSGGAPYAGQGSR